MAGLVSFLKTAISQILVKSENRGTAGFLRMPGDPLGDH